MDNCTYCKKQMAVKILVSMMDMKSKEIEVALHISKSVVSRHLRGERNYPKIDIYIIERLLGIEIKEYKETDV